MDLPQLGSRYRPVSQLGSGAQGAVWLAEDRQVPGRQVAIKCLSTAQGDGPGLARQLRREFALLNQLRHPGLARVHDLGTTANGQPFMVAELFQGHPLDAWWAERSVAQALGALAQLLGVLDFLHRREVVHRDVKPANVLLSADSLKLVDLGLACALDQAAAASGTPGYMAPEVLAGEASGPASDLYAVGVMLHQRLWGRLPFEGSTTEVVRAQLSQEVELCAGDVTPGLASLVAQLLARDPAQRPASAAEVLALLEELAPAEVGQAIARLAAGGLPEPLLVGRQALLEQVEQLLEAAAGGDDQPLGVLVVGCPGEGRSRLCHEVEVLASLRGYTVQRGLPVEQPAAETQLPVTDHAARRARAAAYAAAQVRALGAPLLLVLDQLDDDQLAQQVVQILAASAPAQRPLVCAVATAGGEAERALDSALVPLRLKPLSEPEAAAVVRSMLPARWSSQELAAQAYRLGGGNPRQVTELTRLAAAARLAAPDGAVDLSTAVKGADVEQLARLRVEALPPPLALAGAAVALFDQGVPLALLSRLAGAPDQAQLAALAQHGLLLERGARVAVAGRAVARALLQAAPAHELATLRDAALEAVGDAAKVQRAAVLVNGGAVAKQWDQVLAGAREARRRGQRADLCAAARLYAAVLPQLKDDQRWRASVELAEVYQVLGRNAQAIELLDQVADEAPGDHRTELRCAWADAMLKAGQPLKGLQQLRLFAVNSQTANKVAAMCAKLLLYGGVYQQALDQARKVVLGDDPAQAAEVKHTIGLAHFYLGALDPALDVLQQADEHARQCPSLVARARVCNSMALVHQRRSEFALARARYQECLDLARQMGHLPFEATFLMNLGSVDQQQGDLPAAASHYQQSLEAARRFGGLREVAQVQHNLARLQANLGQRASAQTSLRRSLATCERMGWTALQAHNLLLRAELTLEQGAADPARDDLDQAEELFGQQGDHAGLAEVALARARSQLTAAQPDQAAAEADALMNRDIGVGDSVLLQAHLVRGQAELQREAGEPRLALQQLRAALRLAEDGGERGQLPELQHQLSLACQRCDDQLGAELHQRAAQRLLEQQLEQLPVAMRPAFCALPVHAAIRTQDAAAPGRVAGSGSEDAELLAALLEINKELNAESELRRLLERIIDHAVELTGAERGFLLLTRLGAQGAQARIEVARNIDQETIRRKSFKISRSVAEQVLDSGKPLLTVNAMEEQRFVDFLSVHNLKLRSIACVPLAIGRQVRGAIYLDNRFQTRTFTDQHLRLLSALADQAALAVGNWELAEDNRQRQLELASSQQQLEQLNRQLQQSVEQQSLRLEELTRLARQQQGELAGRYRFDSLVGQSEAMRQLFALMERVKDADAPVYIHGESGTGKELVARALHYNGRRREGPFISVNCGAIPATLLESELFGYERGAFTGAERRHRGLLERADGGSLLLDELGDMPAELQVKLLRVLQDKRFCRVGGEQEQQTDFRLLAASNKDLQQLVAQGTFREDLYYRVNVIRLALPPLRQRREDIPLLVQHLLERHSEQHPAEISRAALDMLLRYPWPGNVRELENEVLRLLALGGQGTDAIQPADLSPHVQQQPSGPTAALTQLQGATLKQALNRLEHQLVSQTLDRCNGVVTEAARQLGMSRVGLHKLIKRHGLNRKGEDSQQ